MPYSTQFGRVLVYAGITLVTAGLVLGFGALLMDANSPWVRALGLVPLGFVALLAGTVAALLGGSARNGSTTRRQPPTPH